MTNTIRKYGYTINGAKQPELGAKVNGNAQVRPVGHERECHGYVYVKIALYPNVPMSKDNWKLKHVLVWEQTHEKTLPKGWIVRFKDGNKRNFDPCNLCALSRGENAQINNLIKEFGIEKMTIDTFDVLKNYAELSRKRTEREKQRPRKCLVCGAMFVPDITTSGKTKHISNAQTCRDCINKNKRPPRKRRNHD